MSWFPWTQARLIQPSFVCKHCGSDLRQEGDKIIACTCSGALSEIHEERQRKINFNREREEALAKRGR